MTGVGELGNILGVWAHPDDEAYLMGGVMAMAADAGQHVACITATDGEAGETADSDRWPPDALAQIRRAEMAESLRVLRVTDHEWLGLPDGGLAGLDPGPAVAGVLAAMERVRPDTLMTFGPEGMTGHSDHRTVLAWSRAALRDAAGPAPRLLAATKTDDWEARFPEINARVFPDGGPGTPADDLAVELVLGDEVLERKVRALEAQASQTSGIIAELGRDRYAAWVREEFWIELSP